MPVVKNEVVPYRRWHFTDINEADVNPHTLTFDSVELPANIVAILLGTQRIAGTGVLRVYPNSGGGPINLPIAPDDVPALIMTIQGELKYAQTVANDDFDLYHYGYITQRSRD